MQARKDGKRSGDRRDLVIRLIGKPNNLPRINADDRGSGKEQVAGIQGAISK
jgi:hypothetical protein